MKPIERAAAWYTDPALFTEWHRKHLLGGCVFNTPEIFLMGRAVDKDDDPGHILDPMWTYPPEQQNAWLIWMVAGDWRQAIRFMPYPLPWVGWERGPGRGLRWIATDRIRQRILEPV